MKTAKHNTHASVIVANVVSVNTLAGCIQSLCTQNYPTGRYEVIFPDGGTCSPEEKDLLGSYQKQYPHLKILKLPGKNRAQLLNAGAQAARSELLLFLESHCLPTKNWVREYVELFNANEIQVARGEMHRLPSDSWASTFEDEEYAFAMSEFTRRGTIASFLHFHNAAIRKKTFFSNGGLSDNLPLLCEYELGARLQQAGTQIVYAPDVKLFHVNPSLQHMSREVCRQGTDRARLLLKHGPEFMNKFFPNPKLIRLLPLLQILRVPLLFVTETMSIIGYLGFYAGYGLGTRQVSRFFFRMLVRNSVRSGALKGLGKSKNLNRSTH